MPLYICGLVKTLEKYMYRNKIMQFLMGLNNSYDSVCAQILLNEHFPLTLNWVLSMVHLEEGHQKLHCASTPIVMAIRGLDNQSSSNSQKDCLYCSHCNTLGHSIERYFKANPHLPNVLVLSHTWTLQREVLQAQ